MIMILNYIASENDYLCYCPATSKRQFSKAMRMNRRLTASAVALACALTATPGLAQDKVLNLYSARHYQTDEALYANFTKATGIKINRIEAGDEPLIERCATKAQRSPADVVLLVDAARLWRAEQQDCSSRSRSAVLDERIPAETCATRRAAGSASRPARA